MNIKDALSIAPVLMSRGAFSVEQLETLSGRLPRRFEKAIQDLGIAEKDSEGEWTLKIKGSEIDDELARSIIQRTRELNNPKMYLEEAKPEPAQQSEKAEDLFGDINSQRTGLNQIFKIERLVSEVKANQDRLSEILSKLLDAQIRMSGSLNEIVSMISTERSHG